MSTERTTQGLSTTTTKKRSHDPDVALCGDTVESIYAERLPPLYRNTRFSTLVRFPYNQAAIEFLEGYAGSFGRGQFCSLGSVAVTGPPGTGKTALKVATAREVIRVSALRGVLDFLNQIYFVKFAVLLDWIENIKFRREQRSIRVPRCNILGPHSVQPSSDFIETLPELMQFLTTKWLIVLDDLGVEQGRPWVLEFLDKVVDLRYQAQLPTIVSLNFKLGDAVREGIISARVSSRLLEGGENIYLEGDDLRLNRALKSRKHVTAPVPREDSWRWDRVDPIF